MPIIAELKEMDGEIWARVEVGLGSPIQLLSPEEIQANSDKIQRLMDQIEQMRSMGEIPAEEVARYFLENEQLHTRLPFDTFRHVRLTEVIRRARLDGANAERRARESPTTSMAVRPSQ
jgi:hypothetical protein